MPDSRAYLRRLAAGGVEPPSVAQLTGLADVEVGPDRATVSLETVERHATPTVTLHGGILCDVADAAMAAAWATGLEEDETPTTLDLQIHFLRPMLRGAVTAEAEVIERGRRHGLVECDLRDDEGRRLARASSKLMTLRGERGSGRDLEDAAR